MTETHFPVNDLLRRRLPTSLAVVSLAGSVASTLFLLSFSFRMGFGLNLEARQTLTLGLSAVFSQLILFVGILVFAVGAVLTSFIVFLMMTQRTRDFGLIKAAGCPNDLAFGYYMVELLLTSSAGCILGVILGFAADLAVSRLSYLAVYRTPTNFWLGLLVFVVFFVLALVFGTRPIVKCSRMPAIEAFSSTRYFGSTASGKFKPISASRLGSRIAFRSLSRRPAPVLRLVLLLALVYFLLTVSIAGTIVAKDTTTSWIERAAGRDMIGVAHKEMAFQYASLYRSFHGAEISNGFFDYADGAYVISNVTLQQLKSFPGLVKFDSRLILEKHIFEVANYTIDPETLATIPVGDDREGDILVVGVDPANLGGSWFMQGRFFGEENCPEAVVGDSVALSMFSSPLVQSLELDGSLFSIVGVCVEPLDNGRVVYLPIGKLLEITGLTGPNIVFMKLDSSIDHASALQMIQERINGIDQDLAIIDQGRLFDENLGFLDSAWSAMLFVPLFVLFSATLCLIAFVRLSIDEQRKEFGVLRAVGARPRIVFNIVAFQTGLVLASSLGLGLSFGVIATLMILVQSPVVTGFAIFQIASWLVLASSAMFLLSLIPALRFGKAPLLKVLTS